MLFETMAFIGMLACLFVVSLFIFWAANEIGEWRERRKYQSWKDPTDANNARLLADSWWFSEDEPTMHMLQRLAQNGSVQEVRDSWRKERAEQSAAEAAKGGSDAN